MRTLSERAGTDDNMISLADFQEMALSFEGVTSQGHFDRQSFRARRIFATVAADGKSANLLLSPEQQQMKCEFHAASFFPVANKWGERGWTVVRFADADPEILALALEEAWRNGAAK